MTTKRSRLAWAGPALAGSLLFAACGGAPTSKAASVESATTGAPGAVAAMTAKYTASPSSFPVAEPLPRPLSAGTKLGWLQCGDVVCAQLTGYFDAAVKAIGGQLIVVKAGASTQQVQSALESLIAERPAAILLPSVQPSTIAAQVKEASADGIATVATGIMRTKAAGIDAGVFGSGLAQLAGRLLADWVASNYKQAKVVFYTTNELSFLSYEEPAFRSELASACSACHERTVDIPLASYGSTAPQLVVSDIESHQDTSVTVFGAAAAASGLVAAMKTASLTTPFIGFSLTPGNLADIQNGAMKAGLGLDYPVLSWTMVDEAARTILHAPLTPDETQQLVPLQWLTATNLHGDHSAGWTGYPDYAARFVQFWQS